MNRRCGEELPDSGEDPAKSVKGSEKRSAAKLGDYVGSKNLSKFDYVNIERGAERSDRPKLKGNHRECVVPNVCFSLDLTSQRETEEIKEI